MTRPGGLFKFQSFLGNCARISQTSPIPRSPDGDKNVGEKNDPGIIIHCGPHQARDKDKTMKIPSKAATAMWFPVVGPPLPERIDGTNKSMH